MVPAERRLVDLGQSKATALVGVSDVSEVVVEVMEGCISSRGLVVLDVGTGQLARSGGVHARGVRRFDDTGHCVDLLKVRFD